MKRLLTCAVSVLAVLLTNAGAMNDVEVRTLAGGAAPPPAAIEQVAWLQGEWRGEGLGGKAEEFMAPPQGGQMMGMFRLTKGDGSLSFYEFYHIAEHQGSLMLRIKHFNPDLTGWEEKDVSVEFPLVAVEDSAVYFNGLTFALEGDDILHAVVNVGDNEEKAIFRYERIK